MSRVYPYRTFECLPTFTILFITYNGSTAGPQIKKALGSMVRPVIFGNTPSCSFRKISDFCNSDFATMLSRSERPSQSTISRIGCISTLFSWSVTMAFEIPVTLFIIVTILGEGLVI